ncbi:MAG: pyridoxal phosphate-dependent aminotransferase [Zetaproteobacteria bacterium]|nr:MAG: pyridoxal phosphate-dependent aminotransferase [Zetaproteobacteria bacterium]
MIPLARRIADVRPSATLAITAKAAELRAAGRDIIALSVGEPDFPTPERARRAAIAAIEEGFTRYTAVAGIPELRAAVADKFRRDNGLDYATDEILVSAGAKQCLYNLMQALIDPGDGVVIPAPYWVSYPDMVRLAGGRPVFVATRPEEGFKLTPQRLRAALDEGCRLLVLNAPSNPTGMAYSRDELAALGAVVRDHPGLVVVSDDIYEKLLFDGRRFFTFAQVNPDLKERTVTCNGVSKAWCMTGWRIGFCAGPRHLIAAMARIQGQSTSNPNAIAQKAALAALTGPQEELAEMVAAYAERRRWLVDAWNDIDGCDCPLPDGAFYVFPSVAGWIGRRTPQGERIDDDVALCRWLLEEAGVALVPGSAFGAPGFLRCSYAVDAPLLEAAVARLRQAIATLR